MTDQELIKALRICEDFTPECNRCPMYGDEDCVANMKELAADRLEALVAENERLKAGAKMLVELDPDTGSFSIGFQPTGGSER